MPEIIPVQLPDLRVIDKADIYPGGGAVLGQQTLQNLAQGELPPGSQRALAQEIHLTDAHEAPSFASASDPEDAGGGFPSSSFSITSVSGYSTLPWYIFVRVVSKLCSIL